LNPSEVGIGGCQTAYFFVIFCIYKTQKGGFYMAIMLSKIGDGTLEVVSKVDSALEYNEESYAEYIKTLDESLLKFKENEQPTRFVLRKVLPYGVGQKIKNQQVRYEKGEMQIQMAFINEEIRAALIDIKNPDYVPDDQKLKYKRASDGLAAEDLIALLDSVGIVSDLFSARKAYMEHSLEDKNLKKS